MLLHHCESKLVAAFQRHFPFLRSAGLIYR
jgi:hypothetical protein